MPGKLRQRRRGGEGLPADTPETTVLPLLEAASQAACVPRAFGLARGLEAAGYYRQTLLGQWNLIHDHLVEHLLEAADPLGLAAELGRHPEPRVRFYVPGLASRLLSGRAVEALAFLRPLAQDEDRRVAEAVQAFGVRPQAEALGPAVVEPLRSWVEDPSPFVRRAAVEGTRARGVWVKRLDWVLRSPALLLPLLEPLRREEERYVANAVGNSLNDISKDHPRLALEIAARWLAERPRGPLTERIVRKGLRSLVKGGDPFALRLLGFGDLQLSARVRLQGGGRVRPNTALVFLLEVRNHGAAGRASLVYEIETPGRLPQRPRRHRYQGGTLQLPEAGTLQVRIRERIFDRRAMPLLDGPCRARFYLNGQQRAQLEFLLQRAEAAAGG